MKKIFPVTIGILWLVISIEQGTASTENHLSSEKTSQDTPPCDVGNIGTDYNENGVNDADELCELDKKLKNKRIKKISKKAVSRDSM